MLIDFFLTLKESNTSIQDIKNYINETKWKNYFDTDDYNEIVTKCLTEKIDGEFLLKIIHKENNSFVLPLHKELKLNDADHAAQTHDGRHAAEIGEMEAKTDEARERAPPGSQGRSLRFSGRNATGPDFFIVSTAQDFFRRGNKRQKGFGCGRRNREFVPVFT